MQRQLGKRRSSVGLQSSTANQWRPCRGRRFENACSVALTEAHWYPEAILDAERAQLVCREKSIRRPWVFACRGCGSHGRRRGSSPLPTSGSGRITGPIVRVEPMALSIAGVNRMWLLLLAILAASASLASPPIVTSASIASIDSLCAGVIGLARSSEPTQIFADFSDASDPNAVEDWRRVADRRSLNQLAEITYPYTQAFVWRDRGVTLVQMYFTSPSGDWARYEDQCFDPTDALIWTQGTLNTFNAIDPDSNASAGVSRVRTTYYALHEKGNILNSEHACAGSEDKGADPSTAIHGPGGSGVYVNF